MELNIEQKLAAEHNEKQTLVLAGPGTGKTTALVARYVHLTKNGQDPKQILCCTFSRSAADELKNRISSETGISARAHPIGTFHALSVRILRAIGKNVGIDPNFDIWTKDWERLDTVKRLQEQIVANRFYEDVDPDNRTPVQALEFIDDSRESLLDPEDASIRASETGQAANIAHAEVYRLYEEYLNTENKIDFPRMVQWACKALQQDTREGADFARQFSHVLVDEYQDINLAQKTLIDSLVGSGASLWAVGDDFQAIYGWRGSDVRYLLTFKKNNPGANIVTLRTNYRSTKEIVNVANTLSDSLREKITKDLTPTRIEEGEVFWDYMENEDDEANAVAEEIQSRIDSGVPLNQIAVLGRTNKLPIAVVRTLTQRGIPVVLRGGVAAFSEYEARLLLTAVAISSDQKTESVWNLRLDPGLYGFATKLKGEDWSRQVKALTTYIENRAPKGLSEDEVESRTATLGFHRDHILGFENAVTLFSMLKTLFENKDDKNRVFVGTIHSAKGLEWDSVFVIGLEDGVLPQRQSSNARVLEEEKRIAYVAITRAQNFLMLSSVGKRDGREQAVSPFIEDMGILREPEEGTNTSFVQPEPQQNTDDAHRAFLSRYSSRNMSPEERDEWVRTLRETRLSAEKEQNDHVADGDGGDSSGWSDQAAGTGLLAEVGYTVRKDGPTSEVRHGLLADILQGHIVIPDWLSTSVQSQWGTPNTHERFAKIRNTINVALGNQKGRANPSQQAIEKWEADLAYLDQTLRSQLQD